MKTRVVIVVLLLMASVLLVLFFTTPEKGTLSTRYYLPSNGDLTKIKQEIQALAHHYPWPGEKKLTHTYNELGLQEFLGNNRTLTIDYRNRMFAEASVFTAINGPLAYMSVGYKESLEFVNALKAIILLARHGNVPIVRYIYGHIRSKPVQELAGVAGDFLEHALVSGLVSYKMKKSELFIAQCLFLYRWVGFLRVTPVQAKAYLPIAVFSAGLGWLVERSKNLTYRKRMALIRRLETIDPEYPSGKVRMIVMMRYGKWSQVWKLWKFEHKL